MFCCFLSLPQDALLLAPVYAAGEQPLGGISSHVLGDMVHSLRPDLEISVAEDLDQLAHLVRNQSRADDLVLAMGAGDVNSLWTRLNASANPSTSTAALAA